MRRADLPSFTFRLVAASASVAALLAAAPSCGSRGPLDDGPVADTSADASADVTSGGASVDASAPPASDASASVDARAVDAGKDGGTIIDCAECLVDQCQNTILQCVQSAACRQTFQCVFTECLSGGAPNANCLLDCAAGDPAGALQVLQVFQCVTGTCGEDCSTLLGAVLGGLGGGGGGAKDAGKPGKKPIPKIAGAFSRWPELMTPAMASEVAADAEVHTP